MNWNRTYKIALVDFQTRWMKLQDELNGGNYGKASSGSTQRIQEQVGGGSTEGNGIQNSQTSKLGPGGIGQGESGTDLSGYGAGS